MKFYLKYILKEIKNNSRFSLLFILNLSLGLTGFIALDGFKNSLEKTLNQKSKSILGADFGISSRRPLLEDERLIVKNLAKKIIPESTDLIDSETIELFSMVANLSGTSRLVQIKAIENNYPFYGKIELDNSKNPYANIPLKQKNIAWVYPEILLQLGIQAGDSIRIGQSQFIVNHVVNNDTAAGISTNMAPRLYISLSNLQKTELVRKGSLAWYSYLYKLPTASPEQLELLRKSVFDKIDNPDVKVFTHKNVSDQVGRLLSYLNDFLGLSSLVALFLASIGTGFLFRSYFKSKTKEIAILISIGSSYRTAFTLHLLQILFLGLISSCLAFIFSWSLIPGLGKITQNLLPFPVVFSLAPSTLFIGIIMGTIGSLLICLPILSQLNKLKPSLLFQEGSSSDQPQKNKFQNVLLLIPGALVFWGLSLWLSNSFYIGTLFTITFFISGLLLSAISIFIFKSLSLFNKLPQIFNSLSLKWALRDLARNKVATFSCFLSIGLGMLLLNLIPQIQESLNEELQSPEKSKVPSLFLFDIQDEQVDQFTQITQSQSIKVSQISPMIRSRLTSVNGKEFNKGKGASQALTREEEREMRFRNRGFNLSYRPTLIDSEKILLGKPFSGIYQEGQAQLPEISLEKRFADRLSLKIGDTMTFDIESIPISGKVVSIRSVKWTSFQPNFFIQFQPGVLNEAPKTFLATIPSLSLEKKNLLQTKIVKEMPNISIVDVSRLVKRLSGIMEQMSWALSLMSALCLLAGFVVIYSIANHQAQTNRWDIGLLKALGASFKDIQQKFILSFAIIAFLAGTFGAMISLILSFFMSKTLFESLWVFDPVTPIISVLGGVLITSVITYFATQKALKTKTVELFSDLQ